MLAVIRWTIAFSVAVLVGMVTATATAWALLGMELGLRQKDLVIFGLQTAYAALVAILPTIILYNVAILNGWTRWPAFCAGGALIPIIGGVFVMVWANNLWAIPVGVAYGLVLMPSGALAGLAFCRALGPVHD